MNVVIGGSRSIKADTRGKQLIQDAIEESGFDITHAGSSGCAGPDQLAIWWAEEVKGIRCKLFHHLNRPENMLGWSEKMVLLWDGVSKHTREMAEEPKGMAKKCT